MQMTCAVTPPFARMVCATLLLAPAPAMLAGQGSTVIHSTLQTPAPQIHAVTTESVTRLMALVCVTWAGVGLTAQHLQVSLRTARLSAVLNLLSVHTDCLVVVLCAAARLERNNLLMWS